MKSRIAEEATLLLVDDDQDLLQVSVDALEGQFSRIIPVSDPREALSVVQKNSIDLVIVDFQMPHINGLELLRNLRRSTPQLPALLLTAYATDPLVLEGLQDGLVFDVVDKPYRFEFLMNRARNALMLPFLWDLLLSQSKVYSQHPEVLDFERLTYPEQEDLLYQMSALLRVKGKVA